MLGAAVFLVEAGTAELVLRSDAICREVRADNWAFAARGCQPEVVRWFLQGFSRGVVGAIAPHVTPVLGVATMTALMGLVAVLVSRMRLRHAIPGYVAVEVVIAATAGLIAYFVSYLA